MNINFEYHDVAASQRLEDFLAKRLHKLENKFNEMVGADVYFKKENSTNPEKGKVCSVRVVIPGSTIFAEASNATFEASVAKVVTDLGAQLQKRKEKLKAH